ncbi:peptidoglycan-binding protein [Xylariaceae sp. FL0662B]|nr:peptidoglycan-binding protein [Xylariaceae sp. FL0662B]
MKVNSAHLAVGLVLVQTAAAVTQSSLYPAVDAVRLTSAFNISIGCLDALNKTVSCDATLLRMAGTTDNYLWDKDNITALCTIECLSTTKTWWSAVISTCSNDYINVRGRQVPALTIPGRILDGMNIACLTPDTDVTLLPRMFSAEIQSMGNITERQTTANSTGYCLIDSYSWVGVDIIRPVCSDTSTDPQCLDPTNVPDENQRIANLYPDSLLCSECFLKMFYLRMASPYLPDLDASDYHLEQYIDIVDVCKATMPELQVRILPQYDNIAGVWDGAPELNSTTSSTTVACNQTIALTDLQNLVVPDPNANGTIYCDAMSTKYNVTTGDLQLAFNAPFCTPDANFTSVCVPAGCTVKQIPYDSTCASVIKDVSTTTNNITMTQFLSWNPNLWGLCEELPSQYVCIGAPGGSYIPPPVFNSTTNDGSQQRGGGMGPLTGSGSAGGGGRNATIVPIGGTAPSPTQSGISPLCTEYALASPGDGCYSLTQLWRIPEADFFAWNTVLGPNGESCSTQLFADYFYCIDIVGASSTTETAAKTSTGAVTAPGPTQSGIISTCDKFAEAISGKGCVDFAAAENITTAQLYAWNPVLGANGENCASQMWADEYDCVGCPESIPGKGYYDFAVADGIIPAQLYTWNTILGANVKTVHPRYG